MRRFFVIGIVLGILVFTSLCYSASLDKAKMFYKYGLYKEAQKELIEVIFDSRGSKVKSEAYYVLGNIAFDQDKLSLALETWAKVVKDFPNSEFAKLATEKVGYLSKSTLTILKSDIEDTKVKSYFSNSEFWYKGRSKFGIDSSYIPKVDLAIGWYDRVIKGWPNTKYAELANEYKMKVIVDWVYEKVERKSAKNEFRFAFLEYMPKLVNAFKSFESDYPESNMLQTFRFQIGQLYWFRGVLGDGERMVEAKAWFEKVKENAEEDDFYFEIAEYRLKDLK